MAIIARNELAAKECIPCHGGTPPLEPQRIDELIKNIGGWQVLEQKRISKTFKFKDFASALHFVDRVGELADQQDHHPDVYLSWGKARIEFTTHAIDGLSENDFIMAAKVDELQL